MDQYQQTADYEAADACCQADACEFPPAEPKFVEEVMQTVSDSCVQADFAFLPSGFVCPVCGTKYRGHGFVIEAAPAEDGGFEDSEPGLAPCADPISKTEVRTLFCSRSPHPARGGFEGVRPRVSEGMERVWAYGELSDVDDIYSERRARIVRRTRGEAAD